VFNFILHKNTNENDIERLANELKMDASHLSNHLIMKSLILCKGPRIKLKVKSKTIYKTNSFNFVYCIPSDRSKSELTLYLDSKDLSGLEIQLKSGDRDVLIALLNGARARSELNRISDCSRLLRLGLSDVCVGNNKNKFKKHKNNTCASCKAAQDSHSRRCLECNILYCKTCKKKMMIKSAKKTWSCRKCPPVTTASKEKEMIKTQTNPVKEALRKFYVNVNESKSEADLDKILEAYDGEIDKLMSDLQEKYGKPLEIVRAGPPSPPVSSNTQKNNHTENKRMLLNENESDAVMEFLESLKLGGCIQNDDFELLKTLTRSDVSEYHDPLGGFLGEYLNEEHQQQQQQHTEEKKQDGTFGKVRTESSIFDDLESLSLTSDDFKKVKKKKKKKVDITKQVDAKDMNDFMDILVAPMDTSMEESSVKPTPINNKRSSFTDILPVSPPVPPVHQTTPLNKHSSFTDIVDTTTKTGEVKKEDDEPELDLDHSKRKGNFIFDRKTSLWWNPKTKYLFDQKKKMYTRDSKTWYRYDRATKKLVAV